MKEKSHIIIVIPVYNEEKVIGQVIDDVKAAGFDTIIVVDDGSSDATAAQAKQRNVIVVSHLLNRGKGAAVKTGIEIAKGEGADIVVTIDGDGQHSASDIEAVVSPMVNESVEVVLGTRTLSRKQMPWYKRGQNTLGDMICYLASGIYIKDSQSGFRAYNKRALQVINTRTDRYEFESEIIREIAHYQLKYKQVGVQTRYTTYSLTKAHKQGFTNGLITVAKLMWHIFG